VLSELGIQNLDSGHDELRREENSRRGSDLILKVRLEKVECDGNIHRCGSRAPNRLVHRSRVTGTDQLHGMAH
jgi:hypothetical protein